MAVGGRAGAVVHRVQPAPGREEHPPARAVRVRFGGEIVAVVDQGDQPDRPVGQVVGDGYSSRFEFGAQPLMLGGLGPVLADPLRGVLDGVPVTQRRHDLLHGGRVTIEFRQQGKLIQGQLAGQLTGRLPGLPGHRPHRQRGLDILSLAAGGLTDPRPARTSLMRGEQRRRFLDRGEVPAVPAAVSDQHVQELARLVAGTIGVQHARHLGQPGLDRRGQAPVTLDDPEPARVVAGDQQRHPHADLGHGGQELWCEVQVLADITGMGGELADPDHGWRRRSPGRAGGLRYLIADRAANGRLWHGNTPSQNASARQRARGGKRGRPAPAPGPASR